MPTVDVMLAVSAGYPSPSSAGNDTIVPPPATPLTMPAPRPASATRKARPVESDTATRWAGGIRGDCTCRSAATPGGCSGRSCETATDGGYSLPRSVPEVPVTAPVAPVTVVPSPAVPVAEPTGVVTVVVGGTVTGRVVAVVDVA